MISMFRKLEEHVQWASLYKMYSAHLTYVHSSVLANHTDKHVGDRDGGQNLSFKKNEGTVKHSQTGPNYKQNKINTDQHRDRAGNSASGIAEPSHPNCLAVSPQESECPTKPSLDLIWASHQECIQQSQCQELLLDNEIADPESHLGVTVSFCLRYSRLSRLSRLSRKAIALWFFQIVLLILLAQTRETGRSNLAVEFKSHHARVNHRNEPPPVLA